MSDEILRKMFRNRALFASLLEEAGVEEPDVFDTKTFFVELHVHDEWCKHGVCAS